MAQVTVETAFNIPLEFEGADFAKRLLAWVIDFGIMVAYSLAVSTMVREWVGFNIAVGLNIVLITIPLICYHPLMENLFNGQSIGKKVFNIRVLNLNGGEPGFGQYILRAATRFFEWPFIFFIGMSHEYLTMIMITCALGLGAVIFVIATKYNQRLGDLIAGTVLVNTSIDLSVKDTIFKNIISDNYKVSFPDVMRLTDADINTIKTVLKSKSSNREGSLISRVAQKVKTALAIDSSLGNREFLETLLDDYNYLATQE